MVQHWSDLVFIHWRYPAEIVQNLLPQGVEVEQFDGSAWVGLIPFHMNDLGFPLVHPLPYVGSFPEVNVRTYVRYGEYSGVWFFSLDINNLERFLTARWGLIAKSKRNKFLWGQVHHPPWQLHSARLLHLDDSLVTAAGLPEPEGTPHVMYSEGVPVRIGWPKKI